MYQNRILDYISDRRYEPQTLRELAEELNIEGEEKTAFYEAAEQLLSEGQVILGSSDAVTLPPPGKEMIGVYRRHERGFGFIVPDSLTAHGDLFIPPGNGIDALTGDRVRAKVISQKRRATMGKSPYIGRIIEVLERSARGYVGTLTKRGNMYVVNVDGRSLHEPVIIRDPHAKNAKVGSKVAIDLVSYPDDFGNLPEGVITEVLGEAGEPNVETMAIMRAFGLEEKFPNDVLEEARLASKKIDNTIPEDREDLTKTFICTIDPPDAKDYDDAISITRFDEVQKDGACYELGVHIADVAHFVKSGGALDKEAIRRGNSTYLPRKVIPMLPEVLSNGVCSLQEGVNRYAKSCFLRYDETGQVVSERFARTVICSAKRLTYLEAQALIGDDVREAMKHTKSTPKYSRELITALKLMDELAKVIRGRRMKQGMIVLGLPDVELVFDDSGRVVDAQPEDDAFTHTIIEMFMVEANEAAARLFDILNIPMIRRTHPDPDTYDLGELHSFARVSGYNIPQRPDRHSLQALLESVRGKPAQQAVHMAVLKTLNKAEYSPSMIGHFALASEHYTHFTSPIRRYPDFVVHRGIDAVIDAADGKAINSRNKKKIAKKVVEDARVPDEEQMHEISRGCSHTERNSETAERELRSYLILELLAEHLGEDFSGTVTGVTSSGIYVQVDKFVIDGFVHVNELPPAGERWKLNANTGALVAQRSGKSITIGDQFVIRIANVDLSRRQMDLVIVDQQSGRKSSKTQQKAFDKKTKRSDKSHKQGSKKKSARGVKPKNAAKQKSKLKAARKRSARRR
ncbi:Ribonuclease R [Poriferisphaera corsica]|uniref:Ribonuclease R n=1 Tax=Poriferisphaera corsica TaxID=2528020 RepID=A0A517YYV5_9BACT|nr:ribonuclease R family protein [Poriferisphaera corsica]QDU35379.1 Ribonuclease R [Poriferisphaera corsica]